MCDTDSSRLLQAAPSVTAAQTQIERKLYRVSVIERNLAFRDMDEEDRALLESELSTLKAKLLEAEAVVRRLHHGEALGSLATTTLLSLLGVCLYGLYRVFQLEHVHH